MKLPLPEVPQQRVLTDWVADSIRAAIVTGRFEPGEKLDQDLIAQELEVSRTPVREAVGILASERLIEVVPHHGAFVVVPSREDIRDIYDIFSILETEIVRRVTPVLPVSLLNQMDKRLADDQAKLDRGNSAEYFTIDSPRFPTAVFEFVDNKILKEIMAGLNNRHVIVRCLAQHQPKPHLSESLREHRDILRAMRQRDAEKAAELTSTHLKGSAIRIFSLMEPTK